MSLDVRDVTGHPVGRLATVLVAALLLIGVVQQYPALGPVVEWAFPVALAVWGALLLSRHGLQHRLTLVASLLLLAGAITRAWFQLGTTTELGGAIANLVPFLGILTELFAYHYRQEAVEGH